MELLPTAEVYRAEGTETYLRFHQWRRAGNRKTGE